MGFMEAKLIDGKMWESENVPASKDNLILFMTPSLQSYTDLDSAESLVLSIMELGNNGKKCVNYQNSNC